MRPWGLLFKEGKENLPAHLVGSDSSRRSTNESRIGEEGDGLEAGSIILPDRSSEHKDLGFLGIGNTESRLKDWIPSC